MNSFTINDYYEMLQFTKPLIKCLSNSQKLDLKVLVLKLQNVFLFFTDALRKKLEFLSSMCLFRQAQPLQLCIDLSRYCKRVVYERCSI
jgi:hypothetical protein